MKIVAVKICGNWYRAEAVFRWIPKFTIGYMRPKTHAYLIIKYSGWYDENGALIDSTTEQLNKEKPIFTESLFSGFFNIQ